MTKIPTSKVGALLVLLVMVVAGACGGGSANTGVASLAGGHTTTTVKKSKAAAKQEMQDAALAFAKCMREHGVDMPDPTFDDSGNGGGVMIKQGGAGGGPGGGASQATQEAAQKTCQPILDKAEQDMPRPSPAEEAKMRDQALKFAKCMRDHGVDMPDPTFDDNGGMKIEMHASGGNNTNGPVTGSSGNGAAPKPPGDDPKVDAAMKACGAAPGFSTSKADK
jgi:hypothetical protein